MKVLPHAWWIARTEARFFARFPKLPVAAVPVACLPSLPALIYLPSMWDPAPKAGALPVGLVHLDTGTQYREHTFNVRQEVAAELRNKHSFGFKDLTDDGQARRLVRALKASMHGACDCARWIGRWRYVTPQSLHPAVDF